MRISIADVFDKIRAEPPITVILVDTCTFLDLFRSDAKKPRVPYQEIQAAAVLLERLNATPAAAHLIVPELIPREYADHADSTEREFSVWTELHDTNQDWLVEACLSVSLPLPEPHRIGPHGIAARFRVLADTLLGKALILDRDRDCLDRAVQRLINKDRPSHKKEMKDSMNLEQCLELSGRLQRAGFTKPRVWVSSNTNDFAQMSTSSQIHSDLENAFTTAGLTYFTSLRAAIGRLRADGEL